MKIMVLVGSYPPIINSAARLYSELSLDLQKKGHDVTVITLQPDKLSVAIDKSNGESKTDDEAFNKIKIIRTTSLLFLTKIRGGKVFRYLLVFIPIVVRGVFLSRPDVILAYTPSLFMGLAARLLAKIKRSRYVLNIQDIHPKVLIDMGYVKNNTAIRLLQKVEVFIYKKADSFIVYSEGNKEYLIQKSIDAQKVFVIPNWFNTNLLAFSVGENDFRKRNKITDKFIIVYAGTVTQDQGLTVVVEAADKLKLNEDILFLIVGEGNAMPLLQKAMTEKKLRNVMFLPAQNYERYVNILSSSDICLISLNKAIPKETVPGKLAEIMACGRPVIASVSCDGDAAKIIKKAGCGFCIEPLDAVGLSREILNIYKDKCLREALSNNARKFAENNFSRSSCTRKYEDVLRSAST